MLPPVITSHFLTMAYGPTEDAVKTYSHIVRWEAGIWGDLSVDEHLLWDDRDGEH